MEEHEAPRYNFEVINSTSVAPTSLLCDAGHHVEFSTSNQKLKLLEDTTDDFDKGSNHSSCTDHTSCDSPSNRSDTSPSEKLEMVLTYKVGKLVYDIESDFGCVPNFITSRIEASLETASFLVTNLKPIIAQYEQWKKELPLITPFYAVKCNPDPVILRLLASLGCSFDCATMGEIELVLNGLGDELNLNTRGIAGTSIVYANPAKMDHMITYAMANGVRMTVFDGEDELHKLASLGAQDKMDLLLRLTTDDKASVCRFSKKFGCPVCEAPRLLAVAKSLGLHVAGVSFHVGSGCGDANAYATALEHTKMVFDAAEELGMRPMNIIDLGGGFPGDSGGYGGEGMPTFQDIAATIRSSIEEFGKSRSLESIRFIAEPGRYFVSQSTTVATKVYSRKGGDSKYQALYVDDGVYGSFNNVVYDHALPVPVKLNFPTSKTDKVKIISALESAEERIPTAVFGPTCDGLDQMCSLDNTILERCNVNDWLIWENMGAYTHTASFVFNGYTHIPSKCYCFV